LNEKSKFHQQLHHKYELEHLYNIYVEIKHYNSLSPITRNFTKKYTDRKTINSNNCAKFEVNWPRVLNLQRDIRKIAYNLMNKVP
jgi:hypothetical protein